jgi:hypothetical protein
VLHRIARHDQIDPGPAFELVVRAALDESSSFRDRHSGMAFPHAVCLMRIAVVGRHRAAGPLASMG